MTHPDPAANPHTGVDEYGNPVTLHVVELGIELPAAPRDEGGEQPSPSQQDGTEPSPSSTTSETSEPSGATSPLKPAPTMANRSAADPTAAGGASSTAGSGTDPQTTPTRLSGPDGED